MLVECEETMICPLQEELYCMAEKRRSENMVTTELVGGEAPWLQQLLKKMAMKQKSM